MAGMLRKVNGRVERRDADGVWRPVSPEEQSAVEARTQRGSRSAAGAGVGAGLTGELSALKAQTAVGAAEAEIPAETITPAVDVEAQQIKNDAQNGSAGQSSGSADGSLDIGDVPGLLSDESARSSSGAARLQKLRSRARGKRDGSRLTARVKVPKEVVVPATAAEVSGPDADGSRLKDGQVRRQVSIKEAPSLLEGRPEWVKQLFEAHFRSELAYQLRRLPSGAGGKNRMKLSRQDYAIGWLVMFDKAREDPAILRAKR